MALNDNDRSIAGFTMAGHALVHWFETSIPIFLVVWLAEFDVGVALFGLIVALGYAPFGLGALPGGILADRYGTKRLILCCLAGMSAAFLVLSLATSIYAIAVGLVLWGVAASIYHPAGLALISTGVDERGTVFAWHGIAGNAGIALGPFVAATLLIFLEWQLVAALLAVPGFLAVVYGLTASFDPTAAVEDGVDAGPDEALSLSELVSNSRALFASAFAIIFVIVTFEGLYYRGMLTYLPEILHDLEAVAGLAIPEGLEGIDPGHYIYVGLLVVGMAGQYAGGKLTDRVEPARGMTVIFAVLAVLALAFVPVTGMGLLAITVLCGVFGFFLFAIQPFYQNAVAVYTPADSRGLSYGYTYLGEFGLGSASIAIGGFVLGGFSLAAFFALIAGFGLAGMVLSAALLAGLDRFVDSDRPVDADANADD
ncbi:MFS transporter [Natronolimnohabitans innermongolicus]|uniref:Major facilitator superfamily MFS 1 n=1 Tax=Natronolimnohabitans innermongolicus JCM 12255 TaxID=1227499 RepID=L9WU18_9EURY|nr:MFS transporter [Natronolimnohabitans innermongolicus]ELY52964.1 major facilitator superfamily MFS 1 [Natronolimnohabitans innermongolicus JCM 12255]